MSVTFDRRQWLSGAGALACTAAFASTARAEDAAPTPLKDLAAAKGMRFGTAVNAIRVAEKIGTIYHPGISAIIARESNILVPENELKTYSTLPSNEMDYQFARADAIAGFAKSNAMALRGHTLIWARDEYTPQWLKERDFGAAPAKAAEALLRAYITTVISRYGSQISSWDVVNETVDPDTGQVRSSAFTRAMGQQALKVAFLQARELLPTTQLVYNDYMSWETGNETHIRGVLELLRWFRKENVPVDALGVQSHLGNGAPLLAGQAAMWKSFMDEVTGMGYDLVITELDVCDQDQTGTFGERDTTVARIAKDYLDLMFSYPQLRDVLCWGLDDGTSWLQGFRPRPDGQPVRPCPFDADLKAKPLRGAIAAAFTDASPR